MLLRKCPVCKKWLSIEWLIKANNSKKYKCKNCKTLLELKKTKFFGFVYYFHQVIWIFILVFSVIHLRWPTGNIILDTIICFSFFLISNTILFHFIYPIIVVEKKCESTEEG